jgi:hypothetical protein
METHPNDIKAEYREEYSLMLAATFHKFEDFAYIAMRHLGFQMTDMQMDIAKFMAVPLRYKMVMAPRAEGKTFLSVALCIWKVIQHPSCRVMIVSKAEQQAADTAYLIVKMITSWHLLCFMRADTSVGDRHGFKHYDINISLKGKDRSPSISCSGLKGAQSGSRVDLLIADDIEDIQNCSTHTLRQQTKMFTRNFSALCDHGQILYLGTPYGKDSIYNTLPGEGYTVRIWPGRIPSEESIDKYGDSLAPYILNMIKNGAARTGFGLDGTMGTTTDPERYTNEELNDQERPGIEWFTLQYMLDTSLSDELRTRIKLRDFIVYSGDTNNAPSTFSWTNDRRFISYEAKNHGGITTTMYNPAIIGTDFIPYKHKVMVVDPSGAGGDEISYAVGGSASAYIHLFSTGGFPGGTTKENMNAIINLALEFDVMDLVIERNMGHGTVEALFQNALEERNLRHIGVRGIYNTQNKERRIIDTISPVTRRHRLVLHTRALDDDYNSCLTYPSNRRWLYSAFSQAQDITYDKGSIDKDDRIDAIAMLIHELSIYLIEDEKTAAEKVRESKLQEWLDNPTGIPEYARRRTPQKSKGITSRLHIFKHFNGARKIKR